ncbi:MAG: helix-turn-helix transcriptional regulator [Lentisphaeria bacterium]|nr:helix-turn-helix transcriptional regulator [Lentisphaeria bacterium]
MSNTIKTFYLEKLRPLENIPVKIRDTYQDESAEAHTHNYIEIAMVHNGRGTHLNHFPDGRIISNTIIKGDIFVVLPGEIHSYANCRGYRVYNLCVDVDFFASLDQELCRLKHYKRFFAPQRLPEVNQLHLLPGAFGEAEEKLRRLAVASRSNSPSSILAMKLALTDYLFTVFDSDSRNWYPPEKDLNSRLFQSIIQLEANPEKKFDLKSVARKAGMSSSGYAHKFKQLTGVPPGDYCLFLKLDKVRQLLEDRQMSLTEVALACGFTDSNYMIRAFKKRFGITPGTYRNNFRQITGITR